MKKTNLILLFLTLTFLFSGCAESQHNLETLFERSHLWVLGHGLIAPFSWLGSLVNNNGAWYNFGFILGVGALTRGTSEVVEQNN